MVVANALPPVCLRYLVKAVSWSSSFTICSIDCGLGNILPSLSIWNACADESKIYWFSKIAELPVNDYLYPNSVVPTVNFWKNTMLGKMIPFTPVVYYHPETQENSQIYKNGFVEISVKKIEYDSETDPVKLVYTSTSFMNDNSGPMISVLVYEVNKNYIPWFNII